MGVTGFHTNLESSIPLTIGTVPLMGTIPSNTSAGDTTVVNMNPAQNENSGQSPVAGNLGWVVTDNLGENNSGLYPGNYLGSFMTITIFILQSGEFLFQFKGFV